MSPGKSSCAKRSGWNAADEISRSNIASHDTASGDYGARADARPREHGHARGQPRAVPDLYFAGGDRWLARWVANAGYLRISDDAVVSDHHVRPDLNALIRGNNRAVVDVDAIADVNGAMGSAYQLDWCPIRVETDAGAEHDSSPILDVRTPEGTGVRTDLIAIT
jgi:hypothetical protein